MEKRLEVRVVGRVQMVMYRDFAMRNAKKLGLTGFVENKEDGSVRVMAEGEESVLNTYLELLRMGSLISHVEEVLPTWGEPRDEYSDFSIRYDKAQ